MLSELSYAILEDVEFERQGKAVPAGLVFKRTAAGTVTEQAFREEVGWLKSKGFLKISNNRLQNTMKGSLAANREI